ncbi:hypothetical protein L6164_022465 [Bauhinia variegata]|uniref:Uncharacterized protein n=1 Tax=Bauhinia variegata TaxID=167791 RepID=A0ACB9MIL8_BAUVA|nr:hypothetical protein L6164_022465 [Bauhinia variegata]
MDETGGTGNSTQGIGAYNFPGIDGGYVELMNSFIEAARSGTIGEIMEDRDQLVLDPDVNYKVIHDLTRC